MAPNLARGEPRARRARAVEASQAARARHGLRPAFLAFARGIDATQPGAGAAASAEGCAARPVRAAPMAAMVTSEMPPA